MRKYNALEEETSVRNLFIIEYFNIGAAYLVKNKAESKEYIAKKILLG